MRVPLLAALALALVRASEFGPNYRASATAQQAQLRADILGAAGYDKHVPPTSDRAATAVHAEQYSAAGADIKMQIRFFKVEAVSASGGSMRLKIWLRMMWTDTRLAWNESAYGGISVVHYAADHRDMLGSSEIWLPIDLQPFNALTGTVQSLEPSYAQVASDGSIFWSRPGSLDVMCKFSGLVAFPFDSLSCGLEFGGFIITGAYQGLNLHDGGYVFEAQEVNSGSSYQEYDITNVTVKTAMYSYPCCPNEPWPVIIYRVTLSRASSFYVIIIIFPGILTTLLAFAVFWTDTGSADSLGYGIGVVVVNLLSGLVLIGLLPVCGELIWVNLFSIINTFFCCLALIQSAVSIMIENCEDDHLFPAWMVAVLHGCLRRLGLGKCAGIDEDNKEGHGNLSAAGEIMANARDVKESIAGVHYRRILRMSGKDVKTKWARPTPTCPSASPVPAAPPARS